MYKKTWRIIITSICFSTIGLLFAASKVSAAEEQELCCPTWAVEQGYKDKPVICGFERSKTMCCKGGLINRVLGRTSWVDKVPCTQIEAPTTELIYQEGVTAEVLDNLNPLTFLSTKKSTFYSGTDFVLANFINELISYLFPIAGLILFIMIVWGGFEMLTGAANKQSLDAGRQRVVAAIIGFLLLFSSYWLIQIIEAITKINIIGAS